jgi:hypothetical protein
VIDELKDLEDRLVARIRELEADAEELQELREIAKRLGIEYGNDGKASSKYGKAPANAGSASSQSRDGHDKRGVRASVRSRAPRGAYARAQRGAASGSPRSTGNSDGAGQRPTRRERVLELGGESPGIVVAELVATMNVNRTSLYPVVRQLISDGLLEKDSKYLSLRQR